MTGHRLMQDKIVWRRVFFLHLSATHLFSGLDYRLGVWADDGGLVCLHNPMGTLFNCRGGSYRLDLAGFPLGHVGV